MRPVRSGLDRIADRGIAFMLSLYVVTRLGARSEIEGYLMTLMQRATQGAREGSG